MSGRLRNVYLAQTRYGTQMRPLPERHGPRTPQELAQQSRVRQIGAAWNGLDADAMRAWAAYGEALTLAQPAAMRRPISGYNAFLALGSTRLRMGGTRVPVDVPPTAPFFGDAVAVLASGTLPPGGGQGGGVLFSASFANALGVLTELLIQPLANAARAIRPKACVSQGFVAFAEDGLTVEVAAKPGWHACAYRFVLEATGQETALAPCGVVRVG